MSEKMKNKKTKFYVVIVTILFVLSTTAFAIVFFRENYPHRIAVKMGWADKDKNKAINYAVIGWNNTLLKLDYDADIVFFGDSITAQSDFREYFPEKKIVTLGYPGDNLLGMQDRVEAIVAVSPEKVFILGGINGLKSYTIQVGLDRYDTLLSMIKEQLPNSDIYVLSVLPISKDRESKNCSNEVIEEFNGKLHLLVNDYGFTYVDIHSLYLNDQGVMDDKLTKDGLHLYPEAYDRWAEKIRQ
jgi:lysophospholipase L1-like esterase